MSRSLKISAGIILALLSAFYSEASTCYYSYNQDTIKVGNELIERQWIWKDGNLYPILIANKSHSLPFKETGSIIKPENSKMPLAVSLKSYIREENSILYEELRVEIVAEYPAYEKKIILSIRDNSPAIRLQKLFRLTGKTESIPELESEVLDGFPLPSLHYTMKSIEFFDRTDVNNNLVQEDVFLPFRHPVEKRGNLLFAESTLGQGSFFVIKEAPCSFVQLNYPGYDFLIHKENVFVCGHGLTNKDLLLDAWVPGYASVIGVVPDNQPVEVALRSYQKTLRKHLPERDEMIMMNTWGDRNRDASINEDFCLREIDACVKYGFTHFQIDDGWQKGLSKNSASSSGKLWDQWGEEHWQPHPDRFPNGFSTVVDYARENQIELGLWFHPSNHKGYEGWKNDAVILANLYKKYGVRYIKIDGVKLPDKKSELNFRRFMDYTLELTDNKIVFNLDATADNRGGYHYFYEYGSIFLENRYTDWANYYPHWTLRNLWQLSKYVPPERLQIEFLNILRNKEKYPADDPLAPANVPFDYVFATTMAAQPLAWFEGSNLSEELKDVSETILRYKTVWNDFHRGSIFPIGEMPSGSSWTGFQSILGNTGYLLIFRENHAEEQTAMKLYTLAGLDIELEYIAGSGQDEALNVDNHGFATFQLSEKHSFALYRYTID